MFPTDQLTQVGCCARGVQESVEKNPTFAAPAPDC